MSGAVLEGRGLRYSFGQTEVLRGVDVAVVPGEIVAVMGPSGSGKSTLLHLLAGLLRPAAGVVEFEGQRVDDLSEERRSELRLSRLGFVFQFGDLVPELSVVENVELPLRLNGERTTTARSRAMEMLDRLGVADEAHKRLSQVSGGQGQRTAVARALVHEPAVVLADEPTGSLDTLTGELVLEALVSAARKQRTAVLMVTHDLRVASYAERDIQLRDGMVVGSSNPVHPVADEAP